jgi:hypothetical protein
VSEAEPLLAVLRRIRRRLRIWAALEGTVGGVALGLAGLAVALGLARWRGVALPLGRAVTALVSVACVGALWRGLRRIPLARCARAADAALDREDRVLSALTLASAPTPLTPMTRALLADATGRAEALAPALVVPPRRPPGLARLALAGIAVAAAALAPVRSRAARAPSPAVADATAVHLAPITRAALAAERAQVRAAEEAARQLGDERIAALAGDLDRTLRQLTSGTLDDSAAIDLLHVLEAKADDAARAAEQERRAAEAARSALRGSEATRAAAEALAARDEDAAERARAALAAAAAKDAGQTAAALGAAARGVAGALAASDKASSQDDPKRRLSREPPPGKPGPPPGAGATTATDRRLEQLRRDLDDTASRCGAGDTACTRQAERRAEDLWRNERRARGAESLRQLQRAVRQMRERVGRGEMRDGDEARAQRDFERGASGQGDGPGELGQQGVARAAQAGEGTGKGDDQRPGEGQPGDGQPGDGRGESGSASDGSGSTAAAEVEAVAAERSGSANSGGDGIGTQAGGAALGREPGPSAGGGRDREARVASGAGPNRAEVIGVAAGKGFATRGYGKVFADYAAAVEDALGATAVPEGKRYIVRRYFDLIRPRTGGRP